MDLQSTVSTVGACLLRTSMCLIGYERSSVPNIVCSERWGGIILVFCGSDGTPWAKFQSRPKWHAHSTFCNIKVFSLSLQSPPHVEDISSGYMMLPRPMSHVLGKIQSQTCWATLLWKLHTLVKGMSKGSVNWKTIAKTV